MSALMPFPHALLQFDSIEFHHAFRDEIRTIRNGVKRSILIRDRNAIACIQIDTHVACLTHDARCTVTTHHASTLTVALCLCIPPTQGLSCTILLHTCGQGGGSAR